MSADFFAVRKFAWDIIKKYDLKIPIDLDYLLQELGIDVEYAVLPQRVDGASLPVKLARGLIVLNVGRSKTRERFTIAHELGHILRHYPAIKEKGCLFLESNRSTLNYEREANVFATELLMPRRDVINAFHYSQSVSELADIFQVSRQAMSIRLEELKLL